jgi:broad specificity phosphatase PhoE
MKRLSWHWGVMLTAGVALAGAPEASAQAQEPTTVLVVRHTEKVSDASDAVLSDEGWERARELQRVTADAGVTVLFASQYVRAQQTLEPIAGELGLEVLVHDARDSEGLAKRILCDHAGEVILVSGHSNTVPEIVAALGAPEPPPIDDAEYDNLFVVSVSADGKPASVLRLRFGRSADEPGVPPQK